MLVLAGSIDAGVGLSGALVSTATQTPTGPVIVLLGVGVAVLAVGLAPGRGLVWRAGKLHRDRRRLVIESVLVDLETMLDLGPPPTVQELAAVSRRPNRVLRWVTSTAPAAPARGRPAVPQQIRHRGRPLGARAT